MAMQIALMLEKKSNDTMLSILCHKRKQFPFFIGKTGIAIEIDVYMEYFLAPSRVSSNDTDLTTQGGRSPKPIAKISSLLIMQR